VVGVGQQVEAYSVLQIGIFGFIGQHLVANNLGSFCDTLNVCNGGNSLGGVSLSLKAMVRRMFGGATAPATLVPFHGTFGC
jgi:hypothetical protein